MPEPRNQPVPRPFIKYLPWILGGLVLLALMAVIHWISPALHHTTRPEARPMFRFIGLYAAAGAVYLAVLGAALRGGQPGRISRAGMTWLIAAGLVMRLAFLGSTPILEDDYHRYLWDGAVAAHGYSPWASVPQEVHKAMGGQGQAPAPLIALARQAGDELRLINHWQLSSIYPPVAQASFVLAYWLRPWDLTAWRAVLLAFDLATLALLLAVLRRMKRPASWAMVYWWCPLVVVEIYNRCHMDVVILPFMLAAILLCLRRRPGWGMGMLGLAIGAKLWPLILAPLLLRQEWLSRRRLGYSLGVLGLVAGPLMGAVLLGKAGSQSGLIAYAQHWYNNSALYQLQMMVWNPLVGAAGLGGGFAHAALRLLVALPLAVWVGWLALKEVCGASDLVGRCALAVAGLYLLSPTQFPWYFVWVMPLLACRTVWPLLLYVVLLPLYYLSYVHPGVIWLEHLPVWIALAALALRSKRPATQKVPEEEKVLANVS